VFVVQRYIYAIKVQKGPNSSGHCRQVVIGSGLTVQKILAWHFYTKKDVCKNVSEIESCANNEQQKMDHFLLSCNANGHK